VETKVLREPQVHKELRELKVSWGIQEIKELKGMRVQQDYREHKGLRVELALKALKETLELKVVRVLKVPKD